MWILLKEKIRTEASPPKLSIFWSVPWPDNRWDRKEKGRVKASVDFLMRKPFSEEDPLDPDAEFYWDGLGFKMPNWGRARRILFRGHAIRVFPHEFSALTPESLRLYLVEEEGWELVPEGAAAEQIMKGVLEKDQKVLYEEALLDGCTHNQALLTALEVDITLEEPEFPAIGWYRCKPEIAGVFCHSWEMEETVPPQEQEQPKGPAGKLAAIYASKRP